MSAHAPSLPDAETTQRPTADSPEAPPDANKRSATPGPDTRTPANRDVHIESRAAPSPWACAPLAMSTPEPEPIREPPAHVWPRRIFADASSSVGAMAVPLPLPAFSPRSIRRTPAAH